MDFNVTCLFLLDWGYDLEEDPEKQSTPARWPSKSESIGVFLFSYEVPPKSVLNPGSQVTFSAKRIHITPPRPGLSNLAESAVSLCALTGVDQSNRLIVGAALLKPLDLMGFDILKALHQADFNVGQEEERTSLIKHVEESKRTSARSK